MSMMQSGGHQSRYRAKQGNRMFPPPTPGVVRAAPFVRHTAPPQRAVKKKRKKKSRPVILAPADLQRNFDNFRADWDDRPTTLCGEPHTR